MDDGIGSSPAFFGSSWMLREERLSTIWIIGSDFLEATATVFFVRLPLPLRAAGRAVITLDRIQTPPESWCVVTLRILGLDCQCRQWIPLLPASTPL